MYPPPEIGSRALFPSLKHQVYANHASVSPLSLQAIAAIAEVCTTQATEAVDAMIGFHENVAGTRAVAARLMGVPAAHIAVLANTSLAISSVAASIDWKAGDTIVLFRGEFPANTTPWQQAANQHGLQLLWIDAHDFDDGLGMQQLEAVLQSNRVRMVAVSAVQFNTGLRMPVEDMATLAHQHGAEIFVDAIQAFGATPFDANDLDYVASGGQKWLMGPPGAALLYAKDWAKLQPTLAGWLSHEDGLVFLWGDPDLLRYDRPIIQGPALFEGGTLNFAGIAGLTAAMHITETIGIANIYAHANQWNDALESILDTLGFQSLRSPHPARRSCMLCAKPPSGHHAGRIASALAGDGISVASPDGHIRFSPSWPNSLEEISTVQAALEKAVSSPSAI